jgi:type I restriction enzyme S subunit
MKCKLSDICAFRKGKVDVSKLTLKTYISTENMLPNKGGITGASSLPAIPLTQEYKKGDVLVSNIRPYFKKIWRAKYDGGCSNDVLVFQGNSNIDRDFLYYVLANDDFFAYSMATSKGTKMPRGDKTSIMQYEVPIFDIDTQRKIASVLRSLDEKIELNSAINNNLLQQTRVIFKHWFTDNPNLDTMKQVPLADLCLVVTKGTTPTTLGKPFVSKGINFIKAESILNNHAIDKEKFAFIDSETNDLLKRSIISSGDIVFTIAGTLGRFALIDDSVLPANTNQAVAIIRANQSKVTPEYLYSFFLGNWHNDYYTKRIQQAVQANLSLGTIKSLPIPILSDKAMLEYLGIIKPIIAMTKANELEITRLRAIRDALLPQLMSGTLDVSDLDL